MKLGFLHRGDVFKWLHDGKTYKAGSADARGYVYCTNTETHKVNRIHLDSDVEIIKEA